MQRPAIFEITLEDPSIMTYRISPDDLKPGTWITIRRAATESSKPIDPELRAVERLAELLRRPSGPPPGLPMKVTAVDLPFVYVRPMDLSGQPDRMEIVDLDEQIVVGCDLEIVKRIETEVYKARCRRHIYEDQMRHRSASRRRDRFDEGAGLSRIEPRPVDDPDHTDGSDFLDDLAA